MTTTSSLTEPSSARQDWMRTLALADADTLAEAWAGFEPKPEIDQIRGPELGLVMVTSRIDGAGDRFNLGEATVARATVRVHGPDLAGDAIGNAYVLGTDLDHALIAAVIDGLLVEGTHRDRLLATVVEPLREADEAARREQQELAHRTQVNFFTVSREHA